MGENFRYAAFCCWCLPGEKRSMLKGLYKVTKKKTLSPLLDSIISPSFWIYNVGSAPSHQSLLSAGPKKILICERIRSTERSLLKQSFPDCGKRSGPNIRTLKYREAARDFNGIHDSPLAIFNRLRPLFSFTNLYFKQLRPHVTPPPPRPPPRYIHSACAQ